MNAEPANDNAPHDPRDYEDFDPAYLPFEDEPVELTTIFELLNN